ncbi:cytosine-purine permease [Xylariaceae sp. FL0016]|nr:cytosine-purine permease [Xylariaceae sp. FL0016]
MASKESKSEDVDISASPDIGYGTSSSFDEQSGSPGVLSRLRRRIQLEPNPGTFAPGRWSNADLDPTPSEERNWSTVNYVFYWANDAIAPGNLRLASALYSMGLSWKLSLVAIALGHFLMAIGLTLNGAVGTRFHIPFTIQSRAPFGFFFSFGIVVIRMIVAGFWYGINTYTGAQCIHVIIVAIWPSFADVANQLPASAQITTQMMVSYLIYFLFVLPFHWIHPRRLRWFFAVKSAICLPAIFGMLIWACVHTHGGTNNEVFRRGNTLQGAELGWAFMSGLNAMLGNYGTLAVNINDFTRYAKSERMTYIQLFIIPTAFMLMSFVGLVIVGSAENIYGELQWDVISIMNNWSDSSAARAGAAFAGICMAIAQMGTNLGANCISAANDLNALFPKYINLRRGSYLIAFIGAWVLVPWQIMASANALLNFMDGYAIFLAPITGILLADFWLVHRQAYDVRELYDPNGRYRYNSLGTNWRAVIAWFVGWVPLVSGLAAATNSYVTISSGGEHIFTIFTAMSYLVPARKTMVHQSLGHIV